MKLSKNENFWIFCRSAVTWAKNYLDFKFLLFNSVGKITSNLLFVFFVSDSFLSCHIVTSSYCGSFCSLFYGARVLVLFNTFVSLCLLGLFLNKVGVKRWVKGAGSYHCLTFALLQIISTLTTRDYRNYTFHVDIL